MPFQTEALDSRTLKRLAQRLRKGFVAQFPDVPCAPYQAQAILASTLGHSTWHAALKATEQSKRSLTPRVQPAAPTASWSSHQALVDVDPTTTPGYEWLKTFALLLQEKTKGRTFVFLDQALSMENVFDPTGLLVLFMDPLVQMEALLPHDQKALTCLTYPGNDWLMEILPTLHIDRLPRRCTFEWLADQAVASLPNPDREGKTQLESLYDRLGRNVNQGLCHIVHVNVDDAIRLDAR